MSNFQEVDFFTDLSLVDDPYPYFEYLRSLGPVCRLPHRNVVAITGYSEAIAVFSDSKTFSSVNAVTGPIPDLPFRVESADIGAQIDQFRPQFPMGGQIVTLDGIHHSATRSLLMRLLTPTRLEENEQFLWHLANQQIDQFIERGQCELLSEYASPYATLVIANLLGVPEEDRNLFHEHLAAAPAQVDDDPEKAAAVPLMFLMDYFRQYVSERLRDPRKDVLTELTTVKFPDGSTPTAENIAWLAAFLFGAGQDTTARLLPASMRILGERPDLQELLRHEHHRIPDFIEEVLRIDSPVKCNFRLARVPTTLGGLDIQPGTTVAIFLGAANRDPRRFECPTEFRFDRPKAKEHLGFGRGAHTCAGAPLARAEVRVSLERLLDRLGDIRVSEEMHGPSGARRYSYEPTYLLRGLQQLHLNFTPSPGKYLPQKLDSALHSGL